MTRYSPISSRPAASARATIALALALAAGAAMAPRVAAAAVAFAGADTVVLDFATPDSTFFSAGDSIWGVTEAVVVTGASTSRTADPAASKIDAVAVAARDARSVAELAPLVPGARAGVNSRGESQVMLRGGSERHVRLFLDGVPLNLPWDERVDLTLLPADAVAGLGVTRGVGSVLDGPNALGGTIELMTPALPGDGRRTRLAYQRGESDAWEARLLHQRRAGPWEVLAAASRREQGGFILPEGFALPYHQGAGRLRTNSDLEQTSLLLRATRAVGRDGTLRLLLAGTDGEKGVPPEGHLEDDARFWRLPEAKRGLAGASLELPLDDADRWRLAAVVAADVSRQEIRAYDNATYTTPGLTGGVDYETDRDRTAFARVRATRRLGGEASLALQGGARYTRHVESLVLDGPELAYAQWLGSLVAEGSVSPAPGWRLRGGAGWETAGTPETGDKPARAATDAVVLHLRADRDLRDGLTAHAAASRRSRFPALRELYSGALGRFVPNPDLRPERQDLVEAGLAARDGAWEAGVTGFASWLDGGIERVALPDRQFQRRNVDDIRTLGVEGVLAWRPAGAWAVAAHHTVLSARRQREDGWTGPVEDRPASVSWVSASWAAPAGLHLDLEGVFTGPRESADVTDEEDGLRRLPAQLCANARVAWRLDRPGPLSRAELFVRVNNVFDAGLWSQTGLPEAGRTLFAGVTAWLDAWEGTPAP